MGEDMIILAHHLREIIARRYFSEEWERKLEAIKKQYGKGMFSHIERLTNHFFNNPTETTITIVPPDSFCNPSLSTICKACLLHPSIQLPPAAGMGKSYLEIIQRLREYQFREYQLDRVKTDKDYQEFLQVYSNLEDVLFLIYYNLEPGRYPSQFLIERIDEVGRRIGEYSQRHLPQTHLPPGFVMAYNSRLDQEFPNSGRLMNGGLYKDFIDPVFSDVSEDGRITAEELKDRKEKYPALFASAGSDEFYYEVLNEL